MLYSHAMGTLPTCCNPGKSLQQQKAYFHDYAFCLNEVCFLCCAFCICCLMELSIYKRAAEIVCWLSSQFYVEMAWKEELNFWILTDTITTTETLNWEPRGIRWWLQDVLFTLILSLFSPLQWSVEILGTGGQCDSLFGESWQSLCDHIPNLQVREWIWCFTHDTLFLQFVYSQIYTCIYIYLCTHIYFICIYVK